MGDQIPPCDGALLRGKGAAHYKLSGYSAVNCAKTTELLKMLMANAIEPPRYSSDAAFLSN